MLQDIFLNQVRKEKIPVTVVLITGGKLTGLIKGFDNFAIFLKHEKDELIYKHAICSIIPHKEIKPIREVAFQNTVKVWQDEEKEEQND